MSGASEIRRAVYLGAAKYSIFPALALLYTLFEPIAAPGFLLGPLALIYVILSGRWDLVSYALRFAFLVLLLALTGVRAGWWAAAVVLICFAAADIVLRRPGRGEIADLEFPLRGGVYYIAHGGSAGLLNRHRASRSQRFALDIVALNFAGARANGIYPKRLSAYRIFGRPVYCPCSGTVTGMVDGLPDEPPGCMDRENAAGNHIVIQSAESEIYVGLAHLMNGSIPVRLGESVRVGQLLGRVGNSGYSSEPHVHVHAKRGGDPQSMLDGDAVPARFGGRWLIRNSLVRV